MNRLKGHIREIEVAGNLSRVTVELPTGIRVNAIVIETPETASYLELNRTIHVLFKETEVILLKDPQVSISLSNRISGEITSLKTGSLFCEVALQTSAGAIQALISKDTLDTWPLKAGETVTAMVKMNEIMLQE
ncbi:MAG: TOBE domain-containing protein [Eudoraea sp.]|nr:TOBE domain-containing protein [Eudoraea sp.]NNK30592.1 TOBE domain-containing protein [Flavobacteriaceae bacterium]